ncbi:hypothetical protein QAD02_010440 [Eretmocerus hayati]|uniref:Uncharacterized protein n=1 Tax=Eretmocerus hayati TaxID=131215 RepID=A0ACC2NU93_9HYME|nr:hypothetical protein QAD02_010440 [Eretmocerus hayati]
MCDHELAQHEEWDESLFDKFVSNVILCLEPEEIEDLTKQLRCKKSLHLLLESIELSASALENAGCFGRVSIDEIDSLRPGQDDQFQWEARKEFMLRNRHKLKRDELICYAQIYVYIKFSQIECAELPMKYFKNILGEPLNFSNLQSTPNKNHPANTERLSVASKFDLPANSDTRNESDVVNDHFMGFSAKSNILISTQLQKIKLYRYAKDSPVDILSRAADTHGIKFEWLVKRFKDNYICYAVFDNFVSGSHDSDEVIAKKKALEILLMRVQKVHRIQVVNEKPKSSLKNESSSRKRPRRVGFETL